MSTDKQPQTCYVPSNEDSIGILSIKAGDAQYILLKELPDRYIYTKEELEERDREKHNFYMQEAIRAKSEAEMYKRQYENFITPFQKEGIF